MGMVLMRRTFVMLLLLPLLIPLLAAAVHATSDLLLSGSVDFAPVKLLIVGDAIYLIISFIGFEYVLDE